MNFETLPPDSDINHLTDTQEKILSLLYVFSGALSAVGSSTIVYKVLKNRRKATPYDRLMLGLSSCDLVASLNYMWMPFLLPEDTSLRVWARGTDTTCTMIGFFTQFSFAAIFYNCILSFYYLLTVRFGVKRQEFSKRYEPYFHTFTLFFFTATARFATSIVFKMRFRRPISAAITVTGAGCRNWSPPIRYVGRPL